LPAAAATSSNGAARPGWPASSKARARAQARAARQFCERINTRAVLHAARRVQGTTTPSKKFFFEKKNQKTFLLRFARCWNNPTQKQIKFLLLFVHKKKFFLLITP
jgi:hypothetical protein